MRKHDMVGYISLSIVLLIALALGLYRINSPLWLDEFYGYRLAKSGLAAIIQNSWTDPHPPFYYLLQWVTYGWGGVQSAISWRWIPLLCTVLTVLTVGITIRKIADFFTGILICLVAATSPSLVFYSQEARPFALLVLLASLSMWITITLLSAPARDRLWIAWVITSLLGLYTGYAYAMIVGIQIVYLGLHCYRQVRWWIVTTIVAIGSVILLPMAASSLGRVALVHVDAEPLGFWRTLQTVFAGEPIRYGFSMAHTFFPLIVLALGGVAGIRSIRGDRRQVYFVLQAALPLILFFSLAPSLGISLPLPEAKQFLVLIPAFLALMAGGLFELRERLGHKIGSLLVMAVCAALIFLNAIGLQSYWTNPKSPEGLAVLSLRDRLQPGESVVSLHYSLSYALDFYTSGVPVYVNPKQAGSDFKYQSTTTGHIFDSASVSTSRKSTEDIRAGGTFWVLAHVAVYRQPIASLVSGCKTVEQETFAARNNAFEIMKIECPMR